MGFSGIRKERKREKENTKVSHVIAGFHLSSKQSHEGRGKKKKEKKMYSSIW